METPLINRKTFNRIRIAASMTCSDVNRNIGRSREGITTKIHLLCNEWRSSRCKLAPDLIALNRMARLIADKAYGSGEICSALLKRKLKFCILMKSNAKNKISHDRNAYKKRQRIENMFARIKYLKGRALRACKCAQPLPYSLAWH